MRLWIYGPSGNCYKARMLCAQLGIEVEVRNPGPRTQGRLPEFLALGHAGRVPLLQLDDGRTLSESDAILCYLAEGTPLWPTERFERAQVLQWMFFEQNMLEPYLATARFRRRVGTWDDLPEAQREQIRQRGYEALGVMERHLAGGAEWFAAGRYTVADVALFGYGHVAEEGGFELAEFPQIRAWIARVKRQPGWLPLADLIPA